MKTNQLLITGAAALVVVACPGKTIHAQQQFRSQSTAQTGNPGTVTDSQMSNSGAGTAGSINSGSVYSPSTMGTNDAATQGTAGTTGASRADTQFPSDTAGGTTGASQSDISTGVGGTAGGVGGTGGSGGTAGGAGSLGTGSPGVVTPAENSPSAIGTAPGQVPSPDDMSRPSTNQGAFTTSGGASAFPAASPTPSR